MEVIEVTTNIKLNYKEEEEVVDVCLAIQEMKRESEMIGEKRGERRGTLKHAQESARNFYKMGFQPEQIARGIGYPVETVRQWLELPGQGAACQ